MPTNTSQLKRIAVQIEMLRLAKPYKFLTNEEMENVNLKADELIRMLKLDDELAKEEWILNGKIPN